MVASSYLFFPFTHIKHVFYFCWSPNQMNFSDPQLNPPTFHSTIIRRRFLFWDPGCPNWQHKATTSKPWLWLSFFLWMNLPFSNHDDLRYAVIFGKELSLNQLTWKFVGGLCSSIPKYIGYAAQLSTPVFVLK